MRKRLRLGSGVTHPSYDSVSASWCGSLPNSDIGRSRWAKQKFGRLPAVLLGFVLIQRHPVQFCTEKYFYAHKDLVAVLDIWTSSSSQISGLFSCEGDRAFWPGFSCLFRKWKPTAKFALQLLRASGF